MRQLVVVNYMDTISLNKSKVVKWIVVAIIVIAVAYLGYSSGFRVGYKQAQADIKMSQDELAKKAGEQAAKAANPFQASSNPLEGVADPLAKTKSILNPFK